MKNNKKRLLQLWLLFIVSDVMVTSYDVMVHRPSRIAASEAIEMVSPLIIRVVPDLSISNPAGAGPSQI